MDQYVFNSSIHYKLQQYISFKSETIHNMNTKSPNLLFSQYHKKPIRQHRQHRQFHSYYTLGWKLLQISLVNIEQDKGLTKHKQVLPEPWHGKD